MSYKKDSPSVNSFDDIPATELCFEKLSRSSFVISFFHLCLFDSISSNILKYL